MTTDITTVEADGQFYVSVILDGHEKRYGPYSDTEAAETMAARVCRDLPRRVSPAGRDRRYVRGSRQPSAPQRR